MNNPYKMVFLSPNVVFLLANNVDPDEMPHHAAFHLGLHCLSSTYLGVLDVFSVHRKTGFRLFF